MTETHIVNAQGGMELGVEILRHERDGIDRGRRAPVVEVSAVKALEGMHVLDLSQVMAVPYCMLHGDLGADVIKVEPPGGD